MSWKKAESWTALFSTELNALAAGSIAYASTAWDNTTTLDEVGFISVNLASVAPSATGPVLGIYVLPLNADGVTYGDQGSAILGTQSTTIPSYGYYFGSVKFNESSTAAVQNGWEELAKDLPPGKFAVGIANLLGSALGATGNTAQFSTNSPA
jgi:hypothetical protein